MQLSRCGTRALLAAWLLATAAAQPKAAVQQAAGLASVSGTITVSGGKRLTSGAVILRAERRDGLTAIPAPDGNLTPDGAFVFRDVPPGVYQLRARGETGPADVALFGTYRVHVDGRDITNIRLTLSPGAVISGTVQVEPAASRPPRLTALRLRAAFEDGSAFGDTLTGAVARNGSFRIRGVMPGVHYLIVEGLDHPWTVTRIVSGGRDMTERPFDLEARDTVADVQLTIAPVAAELSGVVRDERSAAVGGAIVVLTHDTAPVVGIRPRVAARVRADENGRYHVRNVRPGAYRVLASLPAEEREAAHGEAGNRTDAAGTPVVAGERQSHVLDLRIGPGALLRSSSR